ncbi:hypothetical protein ACB098_10G176400 [Castanea mollissima]
MVYLRLPSGPLNMESNSEERFHDNKDVIDDFYDLWLKNHPSALSSFEEIKSMAHEKQMIVLLDYNGTLSPIVNNPNQALMSTEMHSAVREISEHFPTAIISGRSRNKVFQFVRLNNIYYARSHGMDISNPSVSLNYGNHEHQTRTIDEKGNDMVNFCPVRDFLPIIQTIKDKLEKIAKDIKGASVEDSKFCLSVHFRCVNEENVGKLKEMVESTMEFYNDFRISEGKKVMEICPIINWDKGHSSNVLPIYIGDDKTDEDAFKMIKSIGRGFPVAVSTSPKETEALYSLRDPTEVMSFLILLAKWKMGCTV